MTLTINKTRRSDRGQQQVKWAGSERHKNFNTPVPSYTLLCTPKIFVRWRGHANLLYSNWLNYYVYHVTPYEVNQIP